MVMVVARVLWDYRDGEVLLLDDILWAKHYRLEVRDVLGIHRREPVVLPGDA
jgi:hypothetical protein